MEEAITRGDTRIITTKSTIRSIKLKCVGTLNNMELVP